MLKISDSFKSVNGSNQIISDMGILLMSLKFMFSQTQRILVSSRELNWTHPNRSNGSQRGVYSLDYNESTSFSRTWQHPSIRRRRKGVCTRGGTWGKWETWKEEDGGDGMWGKGECSRDIDIRWRRRRSKRSMEKKGRRRQRRRDSNRLLRLCCMTDWHWDTRQTQNVGSRRESLGGSNWNAVS